MVVGVLTRCGRRSSSTHVSCACGRGRRFCSLPCSSQHRRAAWMASGRSRWRSEATVSRQLSRWAPIGTPTVTGSGCRGMSQSSLGAMVACDGRSLAGPTHLSAVCERRSTDRSRSTVWVLGQTMWRVSPPLAPRSSRSKVAPASRWFRSLTTLQATAERCVLDHVERLI